MNDCTTEVTGLTRVIRLGFIDLQKVFAMGRVKQFGVDEEALVVVSLLGLAGRYCEESFARKCYWCAL